MMMAYTSARDERAMEDPVRADTEDLKAWSVEVAEGEAPAFMEGMLKPAAAAGVEVLVARADMVFGTDHLRSALYHAKRAMRERTNASDSLAMETLLYASGERQLSSAIKKMSVDARTKELVVAQLSGGKLSVGHGWSELKESPGDISRDRLLRFCIGERELETHGHRGGVELVLERVAAVDILKK